MQESNPRQLHYKGSALPTELIRHVTYFPKPLETKSSRVGHHFDNTSQGLIRSKGGVATKYRFITLVCQQNFHGGLC